MSELKFFIDTEFIERGNKSPVTLISLGIVAEDGREYYAVSSEFNDGDASEWVKANVLPHIHGIPRKPLKQIAAEVLNFIGSDKPQFWGYYSDYDWVVFCQMFGTMMDLPDGWPMFCLDLKQLCVEKGNPELPKQGSGEHDALADAYWNKQAHEFLVSTMEAAQ